MEINFICCGINICTIESNIIPDNEDKIKINDGFYIVNDRQFVITKNNNMYLKVFLSEI